MTLLSMDLKSNQNKGGRMEEHVWVNINIDSVLKIKRPLKRIREDI